MIQSEIDFNKVVHEHERGETRNHLKLNYDKFSKQAKLVYDLLMRGERLTHLKCINQHGIGSISARVSELMAVQVPIEKEWELDDDGVTTRNRVYFISEKNRVGGNK